MISKCHSVFMVIILTFCRLMRYRFMLMYVFYLYFHYFSTIILRLCMGVSVGGQEDISPTF